MIARSQMPRELYNKGTMPARNKKNFRPTKKGAGMTKAGVKAYRRLNPGSKLKTAVTGKVKRIKKPFARKIQILTVMEQRAKVMGKSQVASIAKKGKEAIRNAINRKR